MAANSTAVNGASDREEATTKAEEKSRSKLLRESCRRFWLSVNPLYQTLVLGMVLLVYLAASARVFMWLEADAEEERMVEVSRTRGELKLMLSMELPNATSERIDSILDTAACDAYLKLQANETVRLWDMGRAVVVAASIVATIGKCASLYAHMYSLHYIWLVFIVIKARTRVYIFIPCARHRWRCPVNQQVPCRGDYHCICLIWDSPHRGLLDCDGTATKPHPQMDPQATAAPILDPPNGAIFMVGCCVCWHYNHPCSRYC